MTTWTPATQQSEAWTSEAIVGKAVFSRLVFSHATHNGKHVFDLGNAAAGIEAWYNRPVQSESWTAA